MRPGPSNVSSACVCETTAVGRRSRSDRTRSPAITAPAACPTTRSRFGGTATVGRADLHWHVDLEPKGKTHTWRARHLQRAPAFRLPIPIRRLKVGARGWADPVGFRFGRWLALALKGQRKNKIDIKKNYCEKAISITSTSPSPPSWPTRGCSASLAVGRSAITCRPPLERAHRCMR